MTLANLPSLKEYRNKYNYLHWCFQFRVKISLWLKKNTNGNFQQAIWIGLEGSDKYGHWYQADLCEKTVVNTSLTPTICFNK